MKREIKFRAWDAEAGEMVYQYNGDNDYYFWMEDKTIYCGIPDLIKEATAFEPADVEMRQMGHVMQFTGIKDKNGRDVYEGDLLRLLESLSQDDPGYPHYCDIGEIVYSTESMSFILTDGLRVMPVEGLIEVVGNVYENTEFLAE